jgi:hypothetical protein
MRKLVAFGAEANKNHLPGDGAVSGNVLVEADGTFLVEFSWPADWALKSVPKSVTKGEVTRAHELWKTTCFEIFVQPFFDKHYWEINLSPLNKWNAYSFESYRKPSPPQETLEWQLLEMSFKAGHFSARLKSKLHSNVDVQVGIACVLENQKGEKSYWSLEHNGNEPDFHDPASFILERKTP